MRTESEWVQFLLRAKEKPLAVEEIASLATELGESGEQLTGWSFPTADLASTGGPSSLSTVLGPLFLVKAGFRVPKLGVPGRPAGGLDILAQMPNYRTSFEIDEIYSSLMEHPYVHFESGGRFAPEDARTFSLRQKHDCQAVPELAIASLLSKKLAVGVKYAGLDVRVAAHGNFGKTLIEARANARKYIEVAQSLEISPACVLTDASVPYQPFIGRGEALWALDLIFSDSADDWLQEHVDFCSVLASAVCGTKVRASPEDLFSAFRENCVAQGADGWRVHEIAEAISRRHCNVLRATSDGYFSIDLTKLRSVVVTAQSSSTHTVYPDSAGVRLLAKPTDVLKAGDPVLSWRYEGEKVEEFELALNKCISMKAAAATTFIAEVVSP